MATNDIQVHFVELDGNILMTFGTATACLRFTPDQALGFATNLLKLAEGVKKAVEDARIAQPSTPLRQ